MKDALDIDISDIISKQDQLIAMNLILIFTFQILRTDQTAL